MKYKIFKTTFLYKLSIHLILTGLFFTFLQLTASAQGLDRIEKERSKDMLKTIKNEIKKDYYDSEFHGLNLEEQHKSAQEKLDKATTLGQAQGIIAQFLMDLNDSHTWFIPPNRTVTVDYEWQMQMIGNKCFVTAIKPKSDAEAKGLKVGDEVLTIEGFRPNRTEMWKMMYYYNLLSPRTNLRLSILSPADKEPRQLDVASKVRKSERVADLTTTTGIWTYIREQERGSNIDFHRFVKVGNVFVWKPLSFGFDPKQVSDIVNRFNGNSTVIFDLRGNPGGYVVTLEKLVGFLFNKDLKIADVKYRNKSEAQEAKTEGKSVYEGKIIVLIDSKSASASEIFARLMQLEKRGIVVGDHSAGAVMQSLAHPLSLQGMGAGREVWYGVSVTHADVIMSDGKSLEHSGVTPDEFVIPTAEDLAAGRDPIMARAIELAGGKISPEDAGKFFPYQWAK